MFNLYDNDDDDEVGNAVNHGIMVNMIVFLILSWLNSMQSVIFSLSVSMTMEHNTPRYRKFMKCVYFVCCRCICLYIDSKQITNGKGQHPPLQLNLAIEVKKKSETSTTAQPAQAGEIPMHDVDEDENENDDDDEDDDEKGADLFTAEEMAGTITYSTHDISFDHGKILRTDVSMESQ